MKTFLNLPPKSGRLGIIGGAGHLIAAHFQVQLLNRFQAYSGACRDGDFPRLLMVNEAIEGVDETGVTDHELSRLSLREYIRGFSCSNVDAVVLPCASLTKILAQEAEGDIQVINWVNHGAHQIKQKGFQRIGIVGSHSSKNDGIFLPELFDHEIEAVVLDTATQYHADMLISQGIRGYISNDYQYHVEKIRAYFSTQKIDAIWWGCTELSFLDKAWLGKNDIVSMDVLVSSCLKYLGIEENNENSSR